MVLKSWKKSKEENSICCTFKCVIDQGIIFILKQISSVQFQIIHESGSVKIILCNNFISFQTKYSFSELCYLNELIGTVFYIYNL